MVATGGHRSRLSHPEHSINQQSPQVVPEESRSTNSKIIKRVIRHASKVYDIPEPRNGRKFSTEKRARSDVYSRFRSNASAHESDGLLYDNSSHNRVRQPQTPVSTELLPWLTEAYHELSPDNAKHHPDRASIAPTGPFDTSPTAVADEDGPDVGDLTYRPLSLSASSFAPPPELHHPTPVKFASLASLWDVMESGDDGDVELSDTVVTACENPTQHYPPAPFIPDFVGHQQNTSRFGNNYPIGPPPLPIIKSPSTVVNRYGTLPVNEDPVTEALQRKDFLFLPPHFGPRPQARLTPSPRPPCSNFAPPPMQQHTDFPVKVSSSQQSISPIPAFGGDADPFHQQLMLHAHSKKAPPIPSLNFDSLLVQAGTKRQFILTNPQRFRPTKRQKMDDDVSQPYLLSFAPTASPVTPYHPDSPTPVASPELRRLNPDWQGNQDSMQFSPPTQGNGLRPPSSQNDQYFTLPHQLLASGADDDPLSFPHAETTLPPVYQGDSPSISGAQDANWLGFPPLPSTSAPLQNQLHRDRSPRTPVRYLVNPQIPPLAPQLSRNRMGIPFARDSTEMYSSSPRSVLLEPQKALIFSLAPESPSRHAPHLGDRKTGEQLFLPNSESDAGEGKQGTMGDEQLHLVGREPPKQDERSPLWDFSFGVMGSEYESACGDGEALGRDTPSDVESVEDRDSVQHRGEVDGVRAASHDSIESWTNVDILAYLKGDAEGPEMNNRAGI